jgi:hypothetical protein
MEKKQHTPGPWYPVAYANYWDIVDAPHYEAAQLLNEDDYQNAPLNAQLAAAAPGLLEVLSRITNCNDLATAQEYARQAIQKATGI